MYLYFKLELVGDDEQLVLQREDNRNIIQTVVQLLASPSLQVANQAQAVVLNISML